MYGSVLLATDGDVASENATRHAIELAAALDASLHAIYVVDEAVYTAYSGDEYVDEREGPEHGLEEHGEAILDAVATQAADAGVSMTPALRHGVPHEVILAYADEAAVDVIVMGTRRRSAEYRSLLGSVTDRVVRLAARPVAVVKTPD